MAFNVYIQGDDGLVSAMDESGVNIPSWYTGPIYNSIPGEDTTFKEIPREWLDDPYLQYGSAGSTKYNLAKLGGMDLASFSTPDNVAPYLEAIAPKYDWSNAIKKAYDQQVSQFGSGFFSGADDPGQTALKIIAASDLPNKKQAAQNIRNTPQFAQSQAMGNAAFEYSQHQNDGTTFGIPNEVITAVASSFGGPLGMMGLSTGSVIANTVINQAIMQGITTGDINPEALAKTAIPAFFAPEISGALEKAGISPDVAKVLLSAGQGAISGGLGGALGSGINAALGQIGATGASQENSFDNGSMNQVLGIPTTQPIEENSFDTGSMNQVLGIPTTQPVQDSPLSNVSTNKEPESPVTQPVQESPLNTVSINQEPEIPVTQPNQENSFDTGSMNQVLGIPTTQPNQENSFDTGSMNQVLGIPTTQPIEENSFDTGSMNQVLGIPTASTENTTDNKTSLSGENGGISEEALNTWEPQLPAGTNVTIDDSGSMLVTDDQGNVISSTESTPDKFTTIDVGDGSKLVVDITTGDVVDSINQPDDSQDSFNITPDQPTEKPTDQPTEEPEDQPKIGIDKLGAILKPIIGVIGGLTGSTGKSKTVTKSLASKTNIDGGMNAGLGDSSDSSGVPWLSSTPDILKSERSSYKPLELAKLPQMTQFETSMGGNQGGLPYMPAYAEAGSVSDNTDNVENFLSVIAGGLSPLNDDVLKKMQPEFVKEIDEQKMPIYKSHKPVALKSLVQIKPKISHLGNMEGLSSGGLLKKYEKASPAGHNPEFITGLTGFYADGRGTGQSDDIPALLHDGDYVMDAETVSALGDGSSKAGREVLDGFRNKIPHSKSTGGRIVPAKIADGEYVFPASFVTSLGSGDNRRGAKILDGLREKLRAHKRAAPLGKIPPKAKSPLEYIEKVKG
jgi:hypothetical protein